MDAIHASGIGVRNEDDITRDRDAEAPRRREDGTVAERDLLAAGRRDLVQRAAWIVGRPARDPERLSPVDRERRGAFVVLREELRAAGARKTPPTAVQ
jgi:hypothetical protein